MGIKARVAGTAAVVALVAGVLWAAVERRRDAETGAPQAPPVALVITASPPTPSASAADEPKPNKLDMRFIGDFPTPVREQ